MSAFVVLVLVLLFTIPFYASALAIIVADVAHFFVARRNR